MFQDFSKTFQYFIPSPFKGKELHNYFVIFYKSTNYVSNMDVENVSASNE